METSFDGARERKKRISSESDMFASEPGGNPIPYGSRRYLFFNSLFHTYSKLFIVKVSSLGTKLRN